MSIPQSLLKTMVPLLYTVHHFNLVVRIYLIAYASHLSHPPNPLRNTEKQIQ